MASTNKILIIGSSGQLGNYLWSELQKEYTVFGTYNQTYIPGLFPLDIRNTQQLENLIMYLKPTHLIVSAALTNVDLCEEQPTQAHDINVKPLNQLHQLCQEHSIKLVYLSTYYVFDGKKGNYHEQDPTSPLSIYAQTKTAAEQIVLQSTNNLVLRCCKIYSYGSDQRNFVARTIENLNQAKTNIVTNDQFNNPISAQDTALAIQKLLKLNAIGIFNIGGPDRVSNYDISLLIAQYFHLNKELIIPKTTEEYNAKAPRPKECTLDITKLKTTTQFQPKSIHENFKNWSSIENHEKNKG